jgi:hypothetical protein
MSQAADRPLVSVWASVLRASPLRLVAFGGGAAAWWLWYDTGPPAVSRERLAYWVASLVLFGVAFFRPWRIPRPDSLTAAVVALIGAGLLARVVDLEMAPYAVSLDEAIHPFYGKLLLEHDPALVFDVLYGYFHTPQFDFAIQGFLTPWLTPLLAGRMASVVMSILSLLSTYALASRLFGRHVGAFATIVLVCSYWHIAYSRMAHPYMQGIMMVTLALCVLVYAVEENNSFPAFVGGILLGASLFMYWSARIVIPLFGVWWLHGMLLRRFRWRLLLPVALGALVFASPFLQAQGVGTLFFRYNQTLYGDVGLLSKIDAAGWTVGETLDLLAEHALAALAIYGRPGAWLAVHDFSPAAMLDVGTMLLAVAGLAICLARVLQGSCFLLVVWATAIFAVGQVSTDVPQAAYRAAPILPALAIAAGLALARLASALSSIGRMSGVACNIAIGVLALVVLIPKNLAALEAFMAGRRFDTVTAAARVVASHGREFIHYFLAPRSMADEQQLQLIVGDRVVADVPSLSDVLGTTMQASEQSPFVVFILHPYMRAAESAIRRCYPGVVALPTAPPGANDPVVPLLLSPPALQSGLGCELRESDGRGLRATYFKGKNFDGPIVRTRIEDWPMRWIPRQNSREFRSIEWRGFLRVPVAGTYDLRVEGTVEEASASIGDIELQPGRPFVGELQAGLLEVTWKCRAVHGTFCGLSWIPPGGGMQPIPPEFFRPVPGE